MTTEMRDRLSQVRRFDQLVAFLRDELGWPIEKAGWEDLTFEYSPEEIGIDPSNAAKIQEIRRLRPLTPSQPWGIFFIKFEPKRLPVVALRRILSQVAVKKRASSNSIDRPAWNVDDLLFISNYGEGESRTISFAHFAQPSGDESLPSLRVLGWNNLDTLLHLDSTASQLSSKLKWPVDESNHAMWRDQWRAAFQLRHGEVIATSRELSLRLAQLARDIRDRLLSALAIESEKGPLRRLLHSVRAGLIHDLDEHTFADMYAQTIAYGLLSARVASPPSLRNSSGRPEFPLTNPFLKDLLEAFLKGDSSDRRPAGVTLDFDELGVGEVTELLNSANIEAVVRDFGDRNPREDPVVHFYESFLGDYDPDLKAERGVFYTPRPVVSFIVRSVHEVLQSEFGLEDGLADTSSWQDMLSLGKVTKLPEGASPGDPFVVILDPATGTGTFLVEVIEVIHRTMTDRWEKDRVPKHDVDSRWNEYVTASLLPRMFGYEILMAPLAIAHLKVGLKLVETGYRFEGTERVRVHLTNSLESPREQLILDFPALAREAKTVNAIKRGQRFTVILGNPPYSGISANMTESAQVIVDPYKFVDGVALQERKLWLQDDYVKFVRTAQVTIDKSGGGVLGFITNHGFLENPTFRGMRQSLLGSFQRIHVLDLHGNANRKERSPDGSADENVFDIRQGVAVSLFSKLNEERKIESADLWGERETKYDWLEHHTAASTAYVAITPDSPFYFFKPQEVRARSEYEAGWRLPEVFPVSTVGFVTARDSITVQFTESEMWDVVRRFSAMSPSEARDAFGLGPDARDWKVKTALEDVRRSGPSRKLVAPVLYRPFDVRYTYYTGHSRGFYASPCANVMDQMKGQDNVALCYCRREEVSIGYAHFLVSRFMTEHTLLSSKTTEYHAPLYLKSAIGSSDSGGRAARVPNIGGEFLMSLSRALGTPQEGPFGLPSGISPEDILHYAYALFHSPTYRSRFAPLLRVDFPRLLLPRNQRLFRAMAIVGEELTALHLMDQSNSSHPRAKYFGPREPSVERVSHEGDTIWLSQSRTQGFRPVPTEVWRFRVGTYPVAEKWLKERRGRTLVPEEIDRFCALLDIAGLTLPLMDQVDRIINSHGGFPGAFVSLLEVDVPGSRRGAAAPPRNLRSFAGGETDN